MTSKICNICCENYNKTLNSKVTCEIASCGFEACKTCVRTYLLNSTNDPHCMNCKNPWSNNFLVNNLNKSYIENDFKKRRKQLLVDKEISRTPELMNLVARTKLLEDHEKELITMNEELVKMKKLLNEMSEKVSAKKLLIYRIKNGEDTEKEERNKFIMPCSAENCKGYLSSQYKCGVCKLFTCPDCFEIIGYSKDEPHVCKEENVKSAELIKKETKGCPKCGVRIFKIAGCDQMWCTECKVAFSWNTGKIVVNGNIHNPHYYQYLQQNGLNPGTAPRNPGDVICGGLVPFISMNGLVRFLNGFNLVTWFDYFKKNSKKFANFIYENKIRLKDNNLISITRISEITSIIIQLHRLVNHIGNVDLVSCRNKVRTLENHDNLTVQYILNKKTKDELANAIFKNDILRKKSMELLNVYELLNVVGIERFNSIYDYYIENISILNNNKLSFERSVCLTQLFEKIIDLIDEYNGLLKYCNKQLSVVSYTFNLSVGIIGGSEFGYIVIKKKCTQSDVSYYARCENKFKKAIDVSDSSGSSASASSGDLTGKNNHEASSSNM